MASDIPLPFGGMTEEELQEYVAKNPGPVAQVGVNPLNPGPTDIRAQGPSLFERTSDAIQTQQLRGNLPMEAPPTPMPIPESIRSIASKSRPKSIPMEDVELQAPQQPVGDPELDEALRQQREAALTSMIGGAASRIGAGIAGLGAGAVVRPDVEGWQDIAAMGSLGVQQVKTKREAEESRQKREKLQLDINDEKALQDPSSPESIFTRNLLKKKYEKLGIQIPEGLSAKRLKDMGLKISDEDRKKFQNVTFEIPGVGPVVGRFDPDTGETSISPVSGVNGMQAAVRGYAPKVDPRTGEMATIMGLMAEKAKPAPDKMSPQEVEQFQPNVRQTKLLTDERKNYLSRTEKRRQTLSSANRLEQILANPDKLDISAIKTQLPRLMGEVGNLNQMEQDAWTGAPDFYNRFNQRLQTFMEGTITKENVKEFKKLIAEMKKETVDSIGQESNNSSNMLKDTVGIPAPWTQKQLGQYYGQAQEADKAAAAGDTVRMMSPTGQIKLVPKNQVEAATRAGGQVIE